MNYSFHTMSVSLKKKNNNKQTAKQFYPTYCSISCNEYKVGKMVWKCSLILGYILHVYTCTCSSCIVHVCSSPIEVLKELKFVSILNIVTLCELYLPYTL